MRTEAKDICKACGGACCKACGCNYSSDDFENINMNVLLDKLNKGNISIVARLDFQYSANKTPFAAPMLYLRERNINSGVIDLISIASTCSSLTEEGCPYALQNRPYGGAALTPKYPELCHDHEIQETIFTSWIPYQNMLRKIVKRMTGKSVEEQIKIDVENLYYKLFSNDVNEYDSQTSIAMYIDMIGDFYQVFPEEIKRAKKRAIEGKNNVLRLTKQQKSYKI